MADTVHDPITDALISVADPILAPYILARREKGLETYGTTAYEANLPTAVWMKHALDEALDLSVYLCKLKQIEAVRDDSSMLFVRLILDMAKMLARGIKDLEEKIEKT